jgi:hypothetical protein
MRAVLFQMTSVALVCLSMAAIGASQTSPPPAAPGQRTDPSAPQAEKTQQTTIIGCLVQGNPTGTSGERRSETGAANANDYFVRTPAIQVPVGTTVTVGGAGTAKPGTSSGGATTSAGPPNSITLYRITGLDREQLRPHINHRVELQGHLSGNMDGGKTTAKTTVDASGKPITRVESGMDVAGVLHATTIKMVNERCQ